ncbi:MAG: flagellar filament capping protein FliD [Gammaproteobacteria bacterium]|nr:flagellar filament capping protein FliD [Gammaproteobacteria bacterium]
MATLSASGIGSGLDINSLLSQIVQAERTPTENRLNLLEAKAQAEISAFGSLKSAVTSFRSSLNSLKTASGFSVNNVSVGDKNLLTASASSIANDGSYTVEVKSLAQSHSLASVAFDALDTVIGTGTLTFNFGTTDYTPAIDPDPEVYTGFTTNPDKSAKSIEITNANNTVEGIRDAINAADMGVSATVVDDGSGFKLLITSDDSGVANSLEITVDEGGVPADNEDLTGLSQLAFNSGATNAEQTLAASDASIKLNGLTITRETNTISGAIHGVTLNLKSADIGNPTQLTINRDNSNAEGNITNFVKKYNELVATIGGLTEFGGDNGQSGLLLGDTTTRNVLNQIRREIGSVIPNSSGFNTLSSIGITTQRDGTLGLDTAKLNSALGSDFDAVSKMFYSNASPSDDDISFISASAATREGRYDLRISQLATKGSLAGEAVSGSLTIDATNDVLNFKIDGVSSGEITLTHAAYSDMSVLAAEIQSRLNASSGLQDGDVSVSVAYVDGRFEITSDSYGSDSTVIVVANNSTLGLNANAVATDGLDVSGTIDGTLASGKGRQLTGAGAASGLILEITGGSPGNRGVIDFSKGFSGKLDALLGGLLSSSGSITAKTQSLDAKIEDISEQRKALLKRVEAIETRYRSQFVALDVLMGKLNVTSSYLQQQLDALPDIQVKR